MLLVNTPPMGWNSWNTFGENISADLICDIADTMVQEGLAEAGYRYIVLDDGWSEKQRDPQTGKIVPDRKKFSKGIRAVADYVHGKGLKFGLYSCAGVRTCADYPGSFDHEFLDAATFAEYGCDFLKYDFCYFPEVSDCAMLYRRMAHALRASGRDILFAGCCWGEFDVWSWARSAGLHTYRSTYDIHDAFFYISNIAQSQYNKFCYSGNQCFNDLDMLTVGMFGKGNAAHGGEAPEPPPTLEDYKTEFALWSMFGTPLMLGNDIRSMSPEIKALLTNRDLLAINQDAECRPPFMAYKVEENSRPNVFILVKLLHDGDLAIGFFNCKNSANVPDAQDLPLIFENIGFSAHSGYGLEFRDVFTGENLGIQKEFFMCRVLPQHCCKVYRVTPRKL